MTCIYCQKPLYASMNINILFKRNYVIHDACSQHLNLYESETLPILDKLIVVHGLFDKDRNGDDIKLFYYYGNTFFTSYNSSDCDIFLYYEKALYTFLISSQFKLVIKLANTKIYVGTLYRETLL